MERNDTYIDENGRLIFVSPGISSGNVWITVYQKNPRGGTHRLKSKALPQRKTQAEAQADLDAYAKAKGWRKED